MPAAANASGQRHRESAGRSPRLARRVLTTTSSGTRRVRPPSRRRTRSARVPSGLGTTAPPADDRQLLDHRRAEQVLQVRRGSAPATASLPSATPRRPPAPRRCRPRAAWQRVDAIQRRPDRRAPGELELALGHRGRAAQGSDAHDDPRAARRCSERLRRASERFVGSGCRLAGDRAVGSVPRLHRRRLSSTPTHRELRLSIAWTPL